MDDILSLVQELLQPGGKMEQILQGFTHREEQLRFATAVAEAFRDGNFLAAEAGTGVGKTFAYLLPALIYARQSQEKVVVSTKTKALQQQIVERDLPELFKVLGYKLKYVEAKGRDNYLCWNKYQNILAGRRRLEADEAKFIEAILSWAESTRSGDRKELRLNQEMMRHWNVVAADRNNCQRELCRYRDKCFRLKMIKAMAGANLIVANHALLLSDVMTDGSILPEFSHLIIDEAHTFLKESFDRLAHKFVLQDIQSMMQILYVKDRRARKGYLIHLRAAYPNLGPYLDEITPLVEKTMRLSQQLFDSISTGLKYKDSFSFSHIVTAADREKAWFQKTLEIYRQEWKPNMELLLLKLRELCQELEGEPENPDLLGIISTLQEIDDTAFTILAEEIHSNANITWVEYINGWAAAVCSAAVDNSNMLDRQLYQNLNTLIMVSATLAIEDKFDNFISRSGLQQYDRDGRLATILEYSPFDYKNQACMYVVKDMPDPVSAQFNQAVNGILADIFRNQGGRTLVLFTSRKQMQETAAELRPYCEQQGLNLLVQHEDGEFTTLIEEFTSGENSILMGLETFWEGIDLKGDVLKCLVIVKLPFRSPSDPYCSAWERYYKTLGQNSFQHFMLPDAAIRFKQGVGRLIRSETDQGAVVVLDTRIVKRNYGDVFRNSIPIKNMVSLNRPDLGFHLGKWR
jgi:Rad3-related DNA helicases